MGTGSGAKGEGCGRKGAAKWEKMSHKVKSKGLPVRQLVKMNVIIISFLLFTDTQLLNFPILFHCE